VVGGTHPAVPSRVKIILERPPPLLIHAKFSNEVEVYRLILVLETI
jgi:hypothetical protein